eukprot:CAMPEP_0195109258 /NCGR_PEP_ID=MMETSP0448-20130528/88986_1 /TAXON_ID=66468 /ORGANISM="Heterocapsa triquestra, Strain CCMP 448" /LENGTH=248 /DNA_ID=CAMNT_0040145869 /DNA_START=18 /DNA_END=761 /DNA_ORIENTATION=-
MRTRSASRGPEGSPACSDGRPPTIPGFDGGAYPTKMLPKVPSCFVCPIGQQLMADPVSTVDGATFEREHIEAHFNNGHTTSPATGERLSSLELTANAPLKEAIHAYFHLRTIVDVRWKDHEATAADQVHKAEKKLTTRRQEVRELKSALEVSDRHFRLKGGGATNPGLSRNPTHVSFVTTVSTVSGSTTGSSGASRIGDSHGGVELHKETARSVTKGDPDKALTWEGGPAPRPTSIAASPAPRKRTWL